MKLLQNPVIFPFMIYLLVLDMSLSIFRYFLLLHKMSLLEVSLQSIIMSVCVRNSMEQQFSSNENGCQLHRFLTLLFFIREKNVILKWNKFRSQCNCTWAQMTLINFDYSEQLMNFAKMFRKQMCMWERRARWHFEMVHTQVTRVDKYHFGDISATVKLICNWICLSKMQKHIKCMRTQTRVVI